MCQCYKLGIDFLNKVQGEYSLCTLSFLTKLQLKRLHRWGELTTVTDANENVTTYHYERTTKLLTSIDV